MAVEQKAHLIQAEDVPALGSDGWVVRWLVDPAAGAEHIMAYRLELAGGRDFSHVHPDADEVLYVVAGRGVFQAEGWSQDVQPGMALFAPRGAEHALTSAGPEPMVVVGAMSPPVDAARGIRATPPRGVRRQGGRSIQERSVVPTMMSESTVAPTMMGERSFRLLVNPEVGCHSMTQFTGIIPPGQAPLHAHPYEEATYVLSGSGRLWIGDEPFGDLRPGSMAFLPIGVRHTLENTAEDSLLKVLGAFSPPNSPEAKVAPTR